jgi:hypothetical protein
MLCEKSTGVKLSPRRCGDHELRNIRGGDDVFNGVIKETSALSSVPAHAD